VKCGWFRYRFRFQFRVRLIRQVPRVVRVIVCRTLKVIFVVVKHNVFGRADLSYTAFAVVLDHIVLFEFYGRERVSYKEGR
jgi:hypothetical protein